jgi:2-keto-3-deoxy-L-rhamnonate aldolase RhmA
MEFKKNCLREKIKGGGIALGTAMYSFSPAIMEVAGYTGLDFCRIDNEHAWRQDESAENVIRAALLSGICPLLRVDRDNPYLVRKALEAGAGGVIVPHVHDRKDAEAIVQAAKFPPFGKRGYGGLCLSGQWGVNGGTEWMEWSNAETLVIPLQTGDEKVIGNLRKTIEAADKYGKFVIYPGAGFPQWETVIKCKELGVKAIELGHDVTILKAVWAKAIQAMKQAG